MKMDKETLIKQRFWVLFVIFVPLVFIAIIYLGTGVAGEVDEERQKVQEHQKKLNEQASKAKLLGQTELSLLETKMGELKARRETIWKEAWKLQDGLVFWPERIEDRAREEKNGGKALSDRNFGDPIPSEVCATYTDPKVYMPQVEDMAKVFRIAVTKDGRVAFEPAQVKDAKEVRVMIDPVVYKDGWKERLHYVKQWKGDAPQPEEVWLAQEDLWVQNELLNALHEANRSVARFHKLEKPAEGIDPADPNQGSFRNANWQLDLKLFKKDSKLYAQGKITNISSRALPIGQILFGLKLYKDANVKWVLLPVQGDLLAPGKEWPIKETPLTVENDPEGLLGIEQVLEPRTSPIRRIDRVELGYHSHRTFQSSLRPPLARSGSVFTGSTRSGPPVGKGGPKEGGPTGGGPTSSSRLENGVEKLRYSNVTEQVRRMPIGVVVVVDQAHVPEVEAAIATSKLRVQTTQVTWQHFRGTVGTGEPKEGKGGPDGGKGPDKGGSQEEAATNLVELTIYGIASLYERPKASRGDGETGKKDDNPKKDRKPRNPKMGE
ncbi:MAG: hypothetical protein K2R98_04645 [Gemmataceae bacterium]|nr:hypothetical protein [Gemmataceae bacterium]